ncbi:conserved hypothetical protein [Mycoplasma haemofelis str. Langford 1]|uniref:Alcohol dehydrogenase iron-type/glycerol dehydrogenase GldA domain-containing protein n=1 Tax=Mycoplasma haemofelis (strain Langford 1) TaxID=941640 RepID=E8ZKF3_MYCHL|nr:iron-containing alcohol dehydrogenase [Mycoplasma haemofelis]CBY92119.1 conserved hypothetical protein [Mycoplasma haemofelis str. Langford 1]
MDKKILPDFTFSDLSDISDENLKESKTVLKHHLKFDPAQSVTVSNLHPVQLQNIILSPDSQLNVGEPIDLANYDLSKLISIEKPEIELPPSPSPSRNILDDEKKGFNNFHVVDSIEDSSFERELLASGAKAVLIMSDTAYTRNMKFYKRVVGILQKNGIHFVEYTNIQPNLDRKLVFRISEFANDHEVNAVIVIGSLSTIDLSKIVLPKLIKPHLIRLHKPRLAKSVLAPNYALFSIPTLVVPDLRTNSRSTLKNNVLFPKLDYFGDTIFLTNPVDDSNGVFYCADLFDELDSSKIWELLHETFFRLLLNFFDLSLSPKATDALIHNMRTISWYLSYYDRGNSFSNYDRRQILKIIGTSLNGSAFLDISDFWTWYRLEGALSYLVNSKKCEGLALFLPTFIEVLSQHSIEFRERAIELGLKLYGTYSVEGLIFRLIGHIRKYKLPISFLDIPQIKRINYRFLLLLVKKSSNSPFFNKITKSIINNLTVW